MGVAKYQPGTTLVTIMGRIRLDLSSLNVPEDESRLMMLLDSRFKSLEDLVRHLSKRYPEVELGKATLYLNQHFLPHHSSTDLLQDEDQTYSLSLRSYLVVPVKQNVTRSQN